MASTTNLKETLEVSKNHLCCCICTSLLSVPKMLGCGHSFCLECLQKYIDHQKDVAIQRCGFDCPLCNQFTAIPNPVAGWADQFVTDFRMQAMIESTPDSDDKAGKQEFSVFINEKICFICGVTSQKRAGWVYFLCM